MKTFINVAQMKLASLKEGQFVETGGYYTKGDAGQAKYLIVAAQAADGYGDHTLANGTVAVLQDSFGNIFKYGAASGTDSTVQIQAAINANNLVNLMNIDATLSAELDISKTITLKGDGLKVCKLTRDYSVNTGVNPYGINISNALAANSMFDGFQIIFTGVLTGVSSSVYIGLNNTTAANVTTQNCRFDGGNVGVHYKQVAGGLIQNNQIANMVNIDNGVTGYGINTDGADGVTTFKNSIIQCDRHAVYIGATDPVGFPPKNQRHIANDIRWSGAASAASQQAAIKVFDAVNIVCIGNTGVGLKKAYWFTSDIDGLYSAGNSWSNMTVRGADDENIPTGKTLKNIQINDKFDNCVTGLQSTSASNGLWEDLIIDGSQFLNMTTGLQPTYISKWSYNRCKFENLTNGIFTSTSATAPPMGQNDAKFINCTNTVTNFPSGGNSALAGSTTPDVSDNYNDYWVANTTSTSVTNFTGGYHGQVLTILFIQGSGVTTIQVGSGIDSKDGANIVPTGNASILTFKNIRGTWREV